MSPPHPAVSSSGWAASTSARRNDGVARIGPSPASDRIVVSNGHADPGTSGFVRATARTTERGNLTPADANP